MRATLLRELAGDAILGKPVTDVAVTPRVTFTDPQAAAVGSTEAEARERSPDVTVVSHPTGDVAGASTLGDGITGTSHLVIDNARRVGATFTGPATADLLHPAAIAIVGQVTTDRLWHATPSLPPQRGLAPPHGNLRPVTPSDRLILGALRLVLADSASIHDPQVAADGMPLDVSDQPCGGLVEISSAWKRGDA